ncbi:MAG: hypothetical protein DCF19_03850 [Pseudanabaena frigida]|uniref:Uncharacterized protein n=1 Tax=Pseudanabaena frigida TaxID=945775 RepID=A0A2W4WH51_9CYAN|nr:MAG: hypothetical protein DCF19_03850 [Pseudanabaena frigida]
MALKIFSQFLFILQLLVYSAIASAVIKYVMPNLSLLNGLTADEMNVIAISTITFPVALFAFVLWLKR